MLRSILDYWGKAGNDPAGGPSSHPLILHCLDVAAVADALMTARPETLRRIAAAFRLPVLAARRLLLWLIALHDLGKFAGNFQVRVPELAARLGLHANHYGGSARHDAVGLAMAEQLAAELHAQTVARVSDVLEVRELILLLSATTGHHGAPRSSGAVRCSECWKPQQMTHARQFAELMWTFFGVDTIEPAVAAPLDETEFNAASWDIAGLTIVADWLGSNTDWFPYAAWLSAADPRATPANLDDLREYWNDALKRAAEAVVGSGLCRADPSPFDAIHVVPAQYRLRPAQQAACELPLSAEGSLTVLEDQTGSGKTEAALLLFHRLFASDLVDGIFLALPTQATANALYARALPILTNLVLDPAQASAVLSHSARDHNSVFRRGLIAPSRTERLVSGEQEPASIGYTAWLAESTKRALLAQFGVGTIDQSLLTVLRSKHQALRLFGLDRKLLLVDEVHAYDSYQAQVLKTLLARIAARGGHVVLLSATLPIAQRQQFIDAFARGLRGRTSISGRRFEPMVADTHYPLLTRLDGAGITETPFAALQRPHAYAIRYATRIEDVVEALVAAAGAGKAAVWVRNTVAEAHEAFVLLQRLLPPALQQKLQLFHSRFALGDRLRIEQDVLARFGKGSTAEQRAGCILVATQVIEQSLDLDLDVMVTDLAPVDLLIQRAGRLFRHMRDESGNPLPVGPDRRGEPLLWIFGPEREGEVSADWVSAWSRGTALVYDNHAYLWRTARELGDRLDLGAAPRAAMEAVYDVGEDDYPQALQRSAYQAEGRRRGDGQVANFNTIADNEAYENNGLDWPDDMTAPTRLTQPTMELVLARVERGSIVPWADGADDWAMSVVRIRKDNLRGRPSLGDLEAEACRIEECNPTVRWRTLFVLQKNPYLYIGGLEAVDGTSVCFSYDSTLGLRRTSQEAGESA
ncbi:CRISPR-associated helicase Cas3' [Tahibacter sp.]|uniref:CRISPR-associated helicase Cas3' n=1 Tax=Tahibacter sp. TaxID=2056211 RepID=UPI0028C4F317|nr:CRISPR-associated helicase Cas3' [Tahibacter sp.]